MIHLARSCALTLGVALSATDAATEIFADVETIANGPIIEQLDCALGSEIPDPTSDFRSASARSRDDFDPCSRSSCTSFANPTAR